MNHFVRFLPKGIHWGSSPQREQRKNIFKLGKMNLQPTDIIIRKTDGMETLWLSQRLVMEVCGVDDNNLHVGRQRYKKSVRACDLAKSKEFLPDSGKAWRWAKTSSGFYYCLDNIPDRAPKFYRSMFGAKESLKEALKGLESTKAPKRPPIKLDIFKTDSRYWKFFKPHYYLDLPMPPCAEYFVGMVDGELVCHLAVAPLFTAKAYRATRLVVMPEWQGAGVGTQFLNFIMQYHLEGKGRCNREYPTFFHTSHPQLCTYLRNSKKWKQTSAKLHGDNKARCLKSMKKSNEKSNKKAIKGGYGGHFRAIQGFKYLGNEKI